MSKRHIGYVNSALAECHGSILFFHQANKEGRLSITPLVSSLSKSLGIGSRNDRFSDCEALKVLGGSLSSRPQSLNNVRKTRYGYLSPKIH